MKATKINYKRCFNLGYYENEVIGIEIDVEDGEKASDAIEKARLFVESEKRDRLKKIDVLKKILENPDEHTGMEVKKAKKEIEDLTEDLPF